MGVTGGSRVNHGGFSMVCLEGSSLPGISLDKLLGKINIEVHILE